MKCGGAGDAQPLAGSPAAGGQAAGRNAIDGDVARPQPGEEPRQRMEVALHMHIALRAAVDFLALPRRAAGHVDERDLRTGDAEALAERRMRILIGEKIGLRGCRKAIAESVERSERVGNHASVVHALPIIRAGSMQPSELAAQPAELQRFQLRPRQRGELRQPRRIHERNSCAPFSIRLCTRAFMIAPLPVRIGEA